MLSETAGGRRGLPYLAPHVRPRDRPIGKWHFELQPWYSRLCQFVVLIAVEPGARRAWRVKAVKGFGDFVWFWCQSCTC